MKWFLLTVACCMLISPAALAQGFTIKKFHSKILLEEGGSFLVKETIDVNFTEERRGIFRDIPYSYLTNEVEGEQAIGRVVGQKYEIYLTDMQVEGHPFKIEDLNGEAKRFKIGSPDVFHTGDVQYVIQYRVWGAINRFKGHNEFYWNVNGNGWQVATDIVSVEVLLPSPSQKLKEDDFRVFTGKYGYAGNSYEAEVEKGLFKASTNRRMLEEEGLTVVLRLPKDAFQFVDPPMEAVAKGWYYNFINSAVTLQSNGMISVDEVVQLNVLEHQDFLIRRFPVDRFINIVAEDESSRGMDGKVIANKRFLVTGPHKIKKSAVALNDFVPGVRICDSEDSEAGEKQVELSYDLMAMSKAEEGGAVYYYTWLGKSDGQPILNATATIQLPPDAKLAPDGLKGDLDKVDYEIGEQSIQLRLKRRLMANESVVLAIHTQGGQFSPGELPMRVFGDGKFISSLNVDITVQENGKVLVEERLKAPPGAWPYSLRREVLSHYSSYYSQYLLRSPTLFGASGDYLVGGVTSNMGIQDHSYSFLSSIEAHPRESGQVDSLDFKLSYWMYGPLCRVGESNFLNMSLISALEVPSENVRFSIRIEKPEGLDLNRLKLAFGGTEAPVPISPQITYKDGIYTGHLMPGIGSGQSVDFFLELPETGNRYSLWLEMRLLWKNQKMLCITFLLSIGLFFLWFFYGRDKGHVAVVQFFPPESLTSAEAGVLYDGDLNNRDILSLIYGWAADGLIEIEPVGDEEKATDFSLKKLKELPGKTKKFEKTLFNGIFQYGQSVKVSSLAEKLYSTMSTTRSEIEAHLDTKSLFVPGTRGNGKLLLLFGYGITGIAVLMLGASLLGIMLYLKEVADIILGLGILGVAAIGFGRILHRRTPLGQKKFEALMGFREFLKTAEADRLKLLLDQDPAYFGHSLSYAIALGLANQWVEKFAPLLTSPPAFIKSGSTTFDAGHFNRMMSRNLTAMATHFTSSPKPVSSGRGGWGGGSSSSSSRSYSSSRSSFGSSGGSGFSRSGGYSGGGFGGGGGGSW